MTNIPLQDRLDFISDCMSHKGRFGITLVTIGEEHRLLKRKLKQFIGMTPAILKVQEIVNPMIGWDYQSVVSHRIDANGGDGSQFKSGPMSGRSWVAGKEDFLSFLNNDPTRLYLRTYASKATRFRKVYLVDGQVATPQAAQVIEACLSPVHTICSPKQFAAGVDQSNLLKVRDISLDNIYGIFYPKSSISLGHAFDDLVDKIDKGTIVP